MLLTVLHSRILNELEIELKSRKQSDKLSLSGKMHYTSSDNIDNQTVFDTKDMR